MSFADFQDQQQVVRLLQRSISRGRLGHAHLFTGASLQDCEAVARTLAKVLNCQNPPQTSDDGLSLDSCDHCSSCRRIAESLHPDVPWIRPESKSRVITIDQVRDLIQSIQLKATEARIKVGVLVAADRLNPQAANAFLKTLEEPPPRSVFILISTDPQRILETIRSRCLRLNFAGEVDRGLEGPEAEWLTAFTEMAAEGRGGLLGRYQLLGALLARLKQSKEGIERELSAKSDLGKYDDIDPRLRDKWEVELAAAIEAEYRRLRTDALAHLHWWLRDVWFCSMGLPAELLGYPRFQPSAVKVAERITPRAALENLRMMEQTQRSLHSNIQEALALEVGLLKLNF